MNAHAAPQKKPLMLLILFNPQPTARNLNQPPTIPRLGFI
jgi:hypothetical protein